MKHQYTVDTYTKHASYYEVHGSGVTSFTWFNLTDIPGWKDLTYGYNLFTGNSTMDFHNCGSG